MGQNAIYYKGKSYSGGGGGGTEVIANPEDAATDTLTKLSVDGDVYGIKSYKEITKAEYDALPSSKLTDDILYCITDGGATKPGEYFNPVIYSTTEREIGVWTDGKPLYQKTYILTNLTKNAFTVIAQLSNIDTVCDLRGWYIRDWGTGHAVELFDSYDKTSGDDGTNYALLRVSGANLQYRVQLGTASHTLPKASVTIQYTKTADTPGSGKYTTLGVPSVHYSTDEQVIGTWIDGKPLYQKVLDYNSTVINARVDHDVSSLNIETLVDHKAWAQRIAGSSKYILKDGYVLSSQGQTYSFYVRYYATEQQIQTILTLPSTETTDRQVVIIQYTKITD